MNLDKLGKGIAITSSHENPIFDDQRSMADCVSTNTIYVFTHNSIYSRENMRNLFKNFHMNAILIDDQRWLAEYDALQPDAFICHDSRDKVKYALPLYHELRNRKLKIWYDQFSIRPGDDLVEAIERGIKQCNNAIILVTDNLLNNERWASQELRTFINMSFSKKTGKHIIPVWIGVTSDRVMDKSPFLAKISAVVAKKYHFARKIGETTSEICRGMK